MTRRIMLAAAAAALAQTGQTTMAQTDLISREHLFGNPERASVRISPDGERLSWLPPVGGVLNVWVAPIDELGEARAVTSDASRGIRQYQWAPGGEHILYLQDRGGDENWRIYSVDLESGEEICLTPQDGVQARIQHVSHTRPGEILIGINDRDPRLHDVHQVDIDTGESKMIEENTAGHIGYLTDDDFKVRQAVTFQRDGSIAIMERDADGAWTKADEIGPGDSLTTTSLGYNHAGDTEYMIDSRGRNTAALFAIDTKTGEKTLLFEDPKADVGGIMSHPTEGVPQAVSVNYRRQQWHVLDERIRQDMRRLEEAHPGEFSVTSRTLDDSKWIVAYSNDDGPVQYYLYDRALGMTTFLFTNRPARESAPLAPRHDLVIRSRDGLALGPPSPTWTP